MSLKSKSGKLLSRNGHLCTTCCPPICTTRRWTWARVNYPGYWNITQTGPLTDYGTGGAWRVLNVLDDVVIDSGSVNADGWLVGLKTSYVNNTGYDTYFEIGFSCNGIEWETFDYAPIPGRGYWEPSVAFFEIKPAAFDDFDLRVECPQLLGPVWPGGVSNKWWVGRKIHGYVYYTLIDEGGFTGGLAFGLNEIYYNPFYFGSVELDWVVAYKHWVSV
jgi:hypothetical protein